VRIIGRLPYGLISLRYHDKTVLLHILCGYIIEPSLSFNNPFQAHFLKYLGGFIVHQIVDLHRERN
jgi:hypothetical protein